MERIKMRNKGVPEFYPSNLLVGLYVVLFQVTEPEEKYGFKNIKTLIFHVTNI